MDHSEAVIERREGLEEIVLPFTLETRIVKAWKEMCHGKSKSTVKLGLLLNTVSPI